MQDTGYRHEEVLDLHDHQPRRMRLYGNLGISIIVGSVFWAAVLSLPIIVQGKNPVTVVAEAIGYERPIDHPMIAVRDSDLRLIQPAGGPEEEN